MNTFYSKQQKNYYKKPMIFGSRFWLSEVVLITSQDLCVLEIIRNIYLPYFKSCKHVLKRTQGSWEKWLITELGSGNTSWA